jgi:3-oxoacyl-[acyl-carrier protein] reductase
MKRFNGISGIVTGGSRGLGRAIAKAFAAEGAFVGVGYFHNERGARQTVSEICEAGGEAMVLKADVKDPDAVEFAFKAYLKKRKSIEFLINNAAIVDDKPFALMSENSWASVIQTNLGGTLNFSRSVVRSMIAQGKGIIINIGSVAGLAASPGQVNYAASRGGILAVTRTMAAELAPSGIRINAVVPGLLTEGMAQRLEKRYSNAWRERIPLHRFGKPSEVVCAVLFLASDEASYIIGQSLVVDGGLTL